MQPTSPRTHTKGTSRKFMVLAIMPMRMWIQLPRFFTEEMPPRGPLELWLQHARCCSLAMGAEVEVISPGKIFMTRGWARGRPRLLRGGGPRHPFRV